MNQKRNEHRIYYQQTKLYFFILPLKYIFTYFNIIPTNNSFYIPFPFSYNDTQSTNYSEIIFNTSQVLKTKKRKI
jgi:hypothetical protein